MRPPQYIPNVIIGVSALLFAAARFAPATEANGPVLRAATSFVKGDSSSARDAADRTVVSVAKVTRTALEAFTRLVRPLSRADALEHAFRGYFAYRTAHPGEIRKPYLYFVDYGLPSTTPRGYLFDMDSLRVIDGPFTVAHGSGSSSSRYGVPTRFSNASGSNATSLGLYVARALYDFRGHSGGHEYSSVGLRLDGVSTGFNDNALARGVVAHGAPYVSATSAGRSQGCPAMEPARAKQLLPKLAEGGMVFLYAPDDRWLDSDPWVTLGSE